MIGAAPPALRVFRSLGALALLISLAASRPCPEERMERSVDRGPEVEVAFANEVGEAVNLLWVNGDGAEVFLFTFEPGDTAAQHTFPGHVVRARLPGAQTLVFSYTVPDKPPGRVSIEACDGMTALQSETVSAERWPEFDGLVHDASAPCAGHSSDWSCVRYVSPEDVAKRDKASYGYHEDELAGTAYKVGQTVDHMFAWQAAYITNVTAYEGGYLKMEMTDRLKEILYPWYKERKLDSMTRHEAIPGGFTNNHKAYFDIIPLSAFPQVKAAIVKEMRQVLEWWTKQKLRHSETFGVRIYRRDAMLVNHLDRQETHVASAVLQVGQKVDEGWPIEVIHPHRPGRKEVYLQPGQMILYEGARITHGRPMRFRGREFGNIFTHFAPIGWYGLDRNRENPFFRTSAKAHGDEL